MYTCSNAEFAWEYSKLMQCIKRLNQENQLNKKPPEYYRQFLPTAVNDRSDCNYFLDDKIAVYTCIIGSYDEVKEPLYVPDNCDFYAVTDIPIPEGSAWKRIDAASFEPLAALLAGNREGNIDGQSKGLASSLKARYFKMHPHRLFPQYKYSVYVDGSFRIFSDLTEHVNRIEHHGLSCFRHPRRNNVFEEIKECRAVFKDSADNLEKAAALLDKEAALRDYGLISSGMLVREHHHPMCRKIMADWWEAVQKYTIRDQIVMPYVLYKNGVLVDEIATLGRNVHLEYSYEIIPHRKSVKYV